MAKVGDILNAIEAYKALSPVGKRLFREEVGVIRPQQGRGRKRRAKTTPTEAASVAPRRGRKVSEIPATAETAQ